MALDDISQWFESLGVHPVVGGFIVGAVLVILLRSGRSGAKVPSRSVREQSGRGGGSLVNKSTSSGFITSSTSIKFVCNGREIEIPSDVSEQIMSFVRKGDLINAIKLVRHATGAELVEAKGLVDGLKLGIQK